MDTAIVEVGPNFFGKEIQQKLSIELTDVLPQFLGKVALDLSHDGVFFPRGKIPSVVVADGSVSEKRFFQFLVHRFVVAANPLQHHGRVLFFFITVVNQYVL